MAGNELLLDRGVSGAGRLISPSARYTLRGGHAALVVEATLADGTAAVLKARRSGTSSPSHLRGDRAASRRRPSAARACCATTSTAACACSSCSGRPVRRRCRSRDAARHAARRCCAGPRCLVATPDVDLLMGADKAREDADLLPRLWEETGKAAPKSRPSRTRWRAWSVAHGADDDRSRSARTR